MIPRAKALVSRMIAAPGMSDSLRWVLNQKRVPTRWRDGLYRRIAKHARFPERSTFEYSHPSGSTLTLLHRGAAGALYWRSEYELETTRLFCEMAERAAVILDIGAADGLYAILAACANPRARILAFEPGTDTLRVCRANVDANRPATDRVEVFDVALGNQDATSTLYVAGAFGGTSSLNPEFRPESRAQPVRVRRGDSLLAEAGITRVDLVKIDTESTEPDVLRGLSRTLERDHPTIFCEVLAGRTERRLEEILGPLGYRYYWLTEQGPVQHQTITGDPTYRFPNYVFSTEMLA